MALQTAWVLHPLSPRKILAGAVGSECSVRLTSFPLERMKVRPVRHVRVMSWPFPCTDAIERHEVVDLMLDHSEVSVRFGDVGRVSLAPLLRDYPLCVMSVKLMSKFFGIPTRDEVIETF